MTRLGIAVRRIWACSAPNNLEFVDRDFSGIVRRRDFQVLWSRRRLHDDQEMDDGPPKFKSRILLSGNTLPATSCGTREVVNSILSPASPSVTLLQPSSPVLPILSSRMGCGFGTRSLSGKARSKLNVGGIRGYLTRVSHLGFAMGKPWRFRDPISLVLRRHSSDDAPEENDRQKWDDEGVLKDSGQLKAEFEAAKKGFLNIPEAIHALPKMNPNGVYANYNLRLDQIKVYGFDYDYTLAHYTRALQTLIYDLAKKHLVKEYRYPETCLDFKYDPQFSIRGLYYDKKHGNLLKLDFFHSVEPNGCFFGRRRLNRDEIEEQYGGKHISVSDIPNLVALMDLFCLSEACLISDVIQHFVDQNMEFDSAYVYDDVKRSINYVHRSGLMHRQVLLNPAKYLVKNEAVVQMLKTLKAKGKKMFILTNSPFPFVNGGMKFLFQDDGRGGESWRELFDVVVALADKPAFYTSERPFRHYNTKTDMLAFKKLDCFNEHSVYYHGCLKEFLELTKWRGSEVLYCGDHLYTDLRGPAKAGWRTVAIIRELEREIMTQNEPEYRFQQAKYNVVQELMGKYHRLPEVSQEGAEEQLLLAALRVERANARVAMRALFNRYFGSCFLTDTGKESAFAYNVQRYADVYTSRLENLVVSASEPWLYTPFDLKSLPHHIKVPPRSLLKIAE